MNLKTLVESVSRSFALTLLALPHAQRQSVAVTYLLARFADTLTDSGKISLEDRISHLEAWENAILTTQHQDWKLKVNLEGIASAEARLLREGDLLLHELGLL